MTRLEKIDRAVMRAALEFYSLNADHLNDRHETESFTGWLKSIANDWGSPIELMTFRANVIHQFRRLG